MNWIHIGLTLAYFVFFFLCAFAVFWWGRRQRRVRAPFAKDLRLLRGPGETQLTILRGLEDNFPLLWLGTALVPVLAAMVLFEIVRKGNAREGREDYKVFFDGEQLSWPWGEDRHGVDQALGNAKWLKEWLAKVTAEKIEVTPVLNFPGWYVEAKAGLSLRVVNSTWLPSVLTGATHVALSEKQIDLIARQLEQRCRDVEY